MPFPADAESGFAFLFPYRKRRVGPEWTDHRSLGIGTQHRKPLTIQWPALDVRISLCWRAPASLPKAHGMNLLDVIE
jgi:hypothetical protein